MDKLQWRTLFRRPETAEERHVTCNGEEAACIERNSQEVQDEELFRTLLALMRGIGPAFERCAGIGPSKLRQLRLLYERGELSQAELQREVGIDGAAVTRHLQQLQTEGYITRRSHPGDNRVTLVALTEQGRDQVGLYCREMSRFVGSLLAGFSEEERDVLLHMLARMRNNLGEL